MKYLLKKFSLHGIMHQSLGMATLFQAQHLDDLSLTFQGKSLAQQN